MASTGSMDGNLFGIKVNGTLIATSTSCEFNEQVDNRETTSKDDNGRASFEPTKYSGTISGDFLITENGFNYNSLRTLLYNKTKFTFVHGTTVSGDKVRTGTGFFTSLKHSSPQNDNVTGSYSVQITGAVSETTNP